MINLEKVTKLYHTRQKEIKALHDINLSVMDGEFVVVRGPSGSGKTTLLLTIGGMLKPTEGKMLADNREIYALSEKERTLFRGRNIGFVFQMYHLIPYLNVIENVLLSSGMGTRKVGKPEVRDILKKIHLTEREYHKPSELSAGEKQRTAVARALLNQPKIILADEPTGNLDPENANEIVQYLEEFHRSGGTIILATHGTSADRYADRIIHLREGRIEEQ